MKLIFNILKTYSVFTMIEPFLPEKIKIENVGKLATNLHDKKESAAHIRNLMQALNCTLVLKKVLESLNSIKKLA